jgi:hypothetical protein
MHKLYTPPSQEDWKNQVLAETENRSLLAETKRWADGYGS